MHNVRAKWIRLTAPHLKVPRQLQRTKCTPRQARAALSESAARCAEMLAEALGGSGGRGPSLKLMLSFCRFAMHRRALLKTRMTKFKKFQNRTWITGLWTSHLYVKKRAAVTMP